MWTLLGSLKVEFVKDRKKQRNEQKKKSQMLTCSPTNYVPNDDSLFHEYVCVINVKIHTHTLVYINQIKHIYI